MASGVHSVYPQIPSYPQHAHSSSMNGSFSQNLTQFDPSHSVATSQAPTPPPPRPGSQQQMAYNVNGAHTSNGMMPPTSYSAYPDPNNLYAQQQYFGNGTKPQIYKAVYSNVSVLEMEVNGVAVMRRRADSWLNATQILKVAGVDKGKRTKVLEKEVQTGEHEKVQGGYGKYQGTWINYRRGREFCRQYDVEHLLLPLLEYDIDGDGTNAQENIETPTKEQAMAAQRKRMYGGDQRPSSQSAGGTFFKNMSSTAANAVNALNRTRIDSPSKMDGRRAPGNRRPSQPQFNQDPFASSQQSLQTLLQDSFSNNGVISQSGSFSDYQATDSQEPPRKKVRPSPSNSFLNNFDGTMDMPIQEASPTEPSQSFFSQQGQSFMAAPSFYGLPPLAHPAGELEERKRDMLLDLFIDPSRTDFEDHAAFLQLSGDEFEIPIDNLSNTALHWAATLARVALVRKLLEKKFNMQRTNSGGETALIAACKARNNLDQRSFTALLGLLGPSIEIRDGRGRTLLHHIAVSSAMKGRAAVGKYYLESLLEYVIKQSSAGNSQSSNPMTLARFMSEIVNAQDKAGDTALNLAARTSTTAIIDQLIEVGADPQIENRGGLAPVDFGVGNESGTHHREHGVASFDAPTIMNGVSQNSFEEAQDNFISSIKDLLSQSSFDFQTEVKEKQEVLDKTNAALKESGSSLAEERKRLEDLQVKVREKDELQLKIQNLKRVTEETKREIISKSKDGQVRSDIVVAGEADNGLNFKGTLRTLTTLYPIIEENVDFDPRAADMSYLNLESAAPILSNLEKAPVLSGRLHAYKQHNNVLVNQVKVLKGKSTELEERYKKIVSLCTGASETEVEGLLDRLVQAVVSEQKDGANLSVTKEGNGGGGGMNELGRVREFLKLIRESEA